MADPLSPETLTSLLPTLLLSVQLSSPIDALAGLTHTILTSLGFKLQPSVETGNVLTEGRTEFMYTHEQSSMKFEVKIMKLGNRGIVNAIAVEDNRTATLDIPLADYFSPSFFPWATGQSDQRQNSSEAEETSTFTPVRNLNDAFISQSRFLDLISLFKTQIIIKLIPGLRKEGYEEVQETSSDRNNNQQGLDSRRNPPEAVPTPLRDPFLPRPGGHIPPMTFPGNFGRSDLEILGGLHGTTNPIQLPGMGGMGVSPLAGGGMFAGPDLFRPGGGRSTPWGGYGFLPGVPQGARFDPIVPMGVGPPQGLGRGRGRGNRNLGEPDFDELPPPGRSDYDNMFL